jgi:hypothetical protein
MKISDFNERVQAFYAHERQEADGDLTQFFEEGGWYWAKITPQLGNFDLAKNETTPWVNRYEVAMLKNDICHTRHAYLRQLRWNYKLLDIYTPWLETRGKNYITGLAKERIKGEHYG